MTSTRIEASRQSRQADFRTPIRCEAGHVLSIAEQIERFCTRCKSPKEFQEGRAS